MVMSNQPSSPYKITPSQRFTVEKSSPLFNHEPPTRKIPAAEKFSPLLEEERSVFTLVLFHHELTISRGKYAREKVW